MKCDFLLHFWQFFCISTDSVLKYRSIRLCNAICDLSFWPIRGSDTLNGNGELELVANLEGGELVIAALAGVVVHDQTGEELINHVVLVLIELVQGRVRVARTEFNF